MENLKETLGLKTILIIIASGIWAIVLQNAGIIPTSQNVAVPNGIDVSGTVVVSEITKAVDVDITAINGYHSFYDHAGDHNYSRLPVYTGN